MKSPTKHQVFPLFLGAKRREWMGCWGLLGWLLMVSQWIIPENSLRLAPVSFCQLKSPSNTSRTSHRPLPVRGFVLATAAPLGRRPRPPWRPPRVRLKGVCWFWTTMNIHERCIIWYKLHKAIEFHWLYVYMISTINHRLSPSYVQQMIVCCTVFKWSQTLGIPVLHPLNEAARPPLTIAKLTHTAWLTLGFIGNTSIVNGSINQLTSLEGLTLQE